MTEAAARDAHGDDVHVCRANFRPMLNALGDIPQRSCFKLVCTGAEHRVVGLHLLGEGADEILQGYAVALKRGITLDDLRDLGRGSGADALIAPAGSDRCSCRISPWR